MTDGTHHDGVGTHLLHRIYRFCNAWQALPLVALLFASLSGAVTVLFDVPLAAALIAGLAGIATYLFVALRDLEREEPVGVLDEDEF